MMSRKTSSSCAICECSNHASICSVCVNFRLNEYRSLLKSLKSRRDFLYARLSEVLVAKGKADDQMNWRVLHSDKLAKLKEKLRRNKQQFVQGKAKIERVSYDIKVKYGMLESARSTLTKHRVEQLDKFYPNLISTQTLGHMAITAERLHKQPVVIKQICKLFPLRRVIIDGERKGKNRECSIQFQRESKKDMDSDEGKVFIGGIAWDTNEDTLREYFGHYGEVSQAVIMREKPTGRPRGFAFVVFSDPSVLDRVLQDRHSIDGRTVEAKRALSREEQQTSSRTGNFNAGRTSGGGGNFKTKKIFVGGLPSNLTEDGFRQYFENYGQVTDVVIMYDQNTQRPRGFGFITFDTEDAVDRVLQKTFHDLNGKSVEVKRALPKDANPSGGGRGGGYQGYGANTNTNTFDGRADGSRYMQPQTAAGGFSLYPGYGGPGYGYGAANSGVGYGGYSVSGYGSANTGYGGPTGAYGNPNAPPNASYGSGVPGAVKNTWSNQSPGYGASGYVGNAGYGAAAAWSAPGSGGPVSAPRGQSPSGASGYGNQGYGYGNYGGGDAAYSGGYGVAGGRAGSAPSSNAGGSISGVEQHGMGGGYMGSGYGDTNGNSGYANSGWRSDPSQATGGYGDGYGGAQSRQT